VLLIVTLFAGAACRSRPRSEAPPTPPPPKLETIVVPAFQCRDAVVGEAVRNIFIGVLVRYYDVRVVRQGPADIQLEGTVAVADFSSGDGKFTAFGAGASGKSKSASGEYVSGITALAALKGEIVATSSSAQALSEKMLTTDALAQQAALRLFASLRAHGLQRKR
jgi:hypothetical protein